MVTLISAARAALVTNLSVSMLISTIYPQCKLELHTLEIPHYVRQCSWVKKIVPKATSRCLEMSPSNITRKFSLIITTDVYQNVLNCLQHRKLWVQPMCGWFLLFRKPNLYLHSRDLNLSNFIHTKIAKQIASIYVYWSFPFITRK